MVEELTGTIPETIELFFVPLKSIAMERAIYKRVFKCERLEDYSIPYNGKRIESDSDAVMIFRKIFENEGDDILIREVCYALFVNHNNEPIGYYKVSEGGLTMTQMDARMIVKSSLDTFATGVLLCHNHPSNNATPSKSDVDSTTRLKNALALFDIRLLDHIILCENKFYAFSTGLEGNI